MVEPDSPSTAPAFTVVVPTFRSKLPGQRTGIRSFTTWIVPWSRVLVIVQTTVWSESTGTFARLVPLPEATVVAPSLQSMKLVFLGQVRAAGTGLGDRVVAREPPGSSPTRRRPRPP